MNKSELVSFLRAGDAQELANAIDKMACVRAVLDGVTVIMPADELEFVIENGEIFAKAPIKSFGYEVKK
jgi:hypothetical protein